MLRLLFLTLALTAGATDAYAKSVPSQREEHCLALNIYHEARGEPLNGMIAVGQVVLNRVRDEAYPNTICGVISEDRTGGKSCQFSWWCDGKSDEPTNDEAWAASRAVSKTLLRDPGLPSLVADARHYVRCDIRRSWLQSMSFHSRIGQHCFYLDDQGEWEKASKQADDNIARSVFALVQDTQSTHPDALKVVHVPGNVLSGIAERKQSGSRGKETVFPSVYFVDTPKESAVPMLRKAEALKAGVVTREDRSKNRVSPSTSERYGNLQLALLPGSAFDNRSYVLGVLDETCCPGYGNDRDGDRGRSPSD